VVKLYPRHRQLERFELADLLPWKAANHRDVAIQRGGGR
jgi:hypothetical protein